DTDVFRPIFAKIEQLTGLRYQGTFHNTNRGSRGPAAASWFVMHDQVKVGAEDLSTLFRIMRIPCLSTRPLGGRKVTLEQ
ncbi:hypothetical protein EBZ39_14275, partial [bacterium]|nr:hypothetical protein [bacterium]